MLTTRALQLNAEGNYLSTRTPARNAKLRSENVYQGAMSVQNGKGKPNIMRTPFHPKTTQPQRLAKDIPGSASDKAPVHLVTRPNRPLTDKTPFANRTLNFAHTPAPDSKTLKLNHLAPAINGQQATPDSGPGSARLSSTRRHSRAPKASVVLQTPANKGNHWDVSDGDIVIPEMEQVLEIEEEFDDSEEIEYMPPNTLDLPYHPPFEYDLPDYQLLGQAALRSVYSYANEELSPPSFDFTFSDQDLMKWDTLSLPSLLSEDESFTLASKGIVNQTTPKPTTMAKRTTASRPTSALAPTSRVISRPPTAALTRRPATSASIKAPAAKPSSTRPVMATTVVRATHTTTTGLASTTSRAAPSTTRKHPVSTTSAAPLVTRPQASSSEKPTTTSTSRTTTTRAATGTLPKSSQKISANVRPPISRAPISRPLTATSTVRPVTTSVRPSSARAGAIRPPPASTAPRVTSATRALKKPGAMRARGISAPTSPRLRATGTTGAGKKQSAASIKLSAKFQKSDHVNVNPGWTLTVPDVDGVVPSCNETAKAGAALDGAPVLDCNAKQLEKAGDQGKASESNVMQSVHEARALAGDLDDMLAPATEPENEEGAVKHRSPTQALAAVNEIMSTETEDTGVDPRINNEAAIGFGEIYVGDNASPVVSDGNPEVVTGAGIVTIAMVPAAVEEAIQNVEETRTCLIHMEAPSVESVHDLIERVEGSKS